MTKHLEPLADGSRADLWDDRHPSTQHFHELFQFGHLATGRLQEISSECAILAEFMVDQLPDGPELNAGLRALWEAKNCFVVQAARFSGETPDSNKAT